MNKKILRIGLICLVFFIMIGNNVFAVDYDTVKDAYDNGTLLNEIERCFKNDEIQQFAEYVNFGYTWLNSDGQEKVDGYVKSMSTSNRSQLMNAARKIYENDSGEYAGVAVWEKILGNDFNAEVTSNTSSTSSTSTSGDWFGQATSWWGSAKQSGFTIPQEAQDVIDQFSDMINVIGTTLIFVATIVLGIKFIFGSIDGKTEAKEDMITLLVACVFFFGWNGIMGILLNDAHNDIAIVEGAENYKVVLSKMLSIFRVVSNCLLVVGVIYVGIKFIFAGAEGKADLKAKSGFFIIGIILAFCTVNVLSFLSTVINDIL